MFLRGEGVALVVEGGSDLHQFAVVGDLVADRGAVPDEGVAALPDALHVHSQFNADMTGRKYVTSRLSLLVKSQLISKVGLEAKTASSFVLSALWNMHMHRHIRVSILLQNLICTQRKQTTNRVLRRRKTPARNRKHGSSIVFGKQK